MSLRHLVRASVLWGYEGLPGPPTRFGILRRIGPAHLMIWTRPQVAAATRRSRGRRPDLAERARRRFEAESRVKVLKPEVPRLIAGPTLVLSAGRDGPSVDGYARVNLYGCFCARASACVRSMLGPWSACSYTGAYAHAVD